LAKKEWYENNVNANVKSTKKRKRKKKTSSVNTD
jgi:hypothetical protein